MEKIIRNVVVAIVIIISLLVLIAIGNIAFFVSIFNWVQHSIHIITGLDTPLAKGIAALFLAAVVAFPLFGIILAFTPIPQENKGLYRAAVFIFAAIFFFFTYFGGKNTYFNPETGTPTKYYSIGFDGEYKFYSNPGYDPKTGEKLKIVTREVLEKIKKKPEPPKIIERETFSHPSVISNSAPDPAPIQQPVSETVSLPAPEPISESAPEQRYSSGDFSNQRTAQPTVSKRSYNPEYNKKSSVCDVTFKNTTRSVFIIANTNQRELFRVKPSSNHVVQLPSGKYFFKIAGNHSWSGLYVPSNRESYKISLAKGN